MQLNLKYPWIRRAVVLLLAFIVILTYMPMEAFAATNGWRPGSVVYFKNGDTIIGKDGKPYKGSYTDDNRHAYAVKPLTGGKTVRGYCLQRMIMNPSNGSTKYAAKDPSKFFASLGTAKSDAIKLALLYGKQPDSTYSDMSSLLGVSSSEANMDDWWLATQFIVWDFEQGLRKSIASIPDNVGPGRLGTVASGNESADFNYKPIKGRPAAKIYFAMLKAMKAHRPIPKFTSSESGKKNPKSIYMEETSAGSGQWKAVNQKYGKKMTEEERTAARANADYYILPDPNKVKQGLKVMSGVNKDSKYTFTRVKSGQYTLTYKGANLPTTVRHGKKEMKEMTKDNLLVWQASGYQTIATGADDPVDFYFKFKQVGVAVEAGESDDIEFFPELQFPVHKDDLNSGWDNDNCTGMGDAALSSTFELYRDGALVDSITLDAYGSTDYLTDTPWQDSADIPVVESGSYDHIERDKDGNITHQCQVKPTDKAWDANTTYTIKEIPPEGRFPEANPKTRTYKVTYHAQTHNSQTCVDNPENWSAIQYKVDFDDNGTVTTVQGTVEGGDVEVGYVHEFEEQTYINDNYRGLLEIVKTKNDLDPFTTPETSDNGVKPESTKSKWTIELKSGGYEGNPYVKVVPLQPGQADYDRLANNYKATRDGSGTPADPTNPLTVNNFGKIRITDLPYGTYIIREISADNNGYVLESFEINIDTDGKLISKKVNNKAKANKIKVVKTNSETGKTVRWDADRTAFRIRYMGHSEFGDPSQVVNYGKLLPNGANYADTNDNYVFYANKNGEITLPYEIEYGHYQIEELVVPNGYYVGQYDQTGKGTIADMGKVNIVDHKGQVVTPPKSFTETVQVRDAKGNKIESFTGDNKVTYNTYGFSVTEQDPHEDGTDYTTYYAIVDMPNNPVKGKIEITKDGQGHIGWNKGSEGGYSLWKAIWDKITLKDTKFEIYAAEDILQSDGVIPIKAFDTKTDKKIDLAMVSRDHADIAGAKEVWQVNLKTGELIRQTSAKDISKTNKTITDYIISATNGASYKDTYTVRDEEKKLTYSYDVAYTMNYSKGGFNYTDVHVRKKTIADDYGPGMNLEITEPLLKSGNQELGITTMDYDGGNMVRVNRLDSEKDLPEDEVTGVHADFDKPVATVVKPKVETVEVEDKTKPQNPDGSYPTKDEDQVVNAPEIPADWEKANDAWDPTKTDIENFLIKKTDNGVTSYRIWINDGKLTWADCDIDGKFYKGYKQEYSFTTAQHFKNTDGFEFSWDNLIGMTTNVNQTDETSRTTIKNHQGTTPVITESEVYSHVVNGENTIFTGKPVDGAPVYFKTHDGIRTEMYLSGMLTHTKITVTQSQLYLYDKVLPAVFLNGTEINWKKNLKPDTPYFEAIKDDRNYVKAERHEVGKDNKEVYYTIDIVSSNTDPDKGYKVLYPDSTEAIPLITDAGRGAKLTFNSIDDTMVFPIGKPIEIIKTNGKGIAESSNLPLGTYWVREVSSTTGHVNKGEWQKFTLDYKDQYTPLVWDTGYYENEAVSVKIDLEKLFETNFESNTYQAGSGAVFGIYTAEEIKGSTASTNTVDKKAVPADTLVGRMVVSNGHAGATIKLPLGKYYVKELSAPAGYKLNGSKYYFDAIDILTADQMTFAYKDMGISGGITQDGNNGVVIDFDTLYKHNATKVTIDGTVYNMDKTIKNDKVDVTVMDGRTNTQIKVKDGQSTTIKFENGAAMTVSATGQTYKAVVSGTAPTKLDTGTTGNENFTVATEAGATTISYSPKVTKTTWLSEVTYKYVAPKEDATDAEKAKTTELELTSPEGTSKVKATVDYEYGKAVLAYDKATVNNITVDGIAIGQVEDTLTLERIHTEPGAKPEDEPTVTIKATKGVINFNDGVSYTVEFDKTGNLYMSSSGSADKNIETESVLTIDGNPTLPNVITLKNTIAKTYARNNTSAGVINITINGVKNDKLPDEPSTPGTPSTPKGSLEITKTDMETGDTLAGAEFEIWTSKVVNGKTVKDKLVYTGITGADGKMVLSDLTYGTYLYHEVKAPEGYAVDSKYYPVEISAGHVVAKVTMVNSKIKGDFELTKKDAENGHVLAGAKFNILDSNKEVVYTGTTNVYGKLLVKDLVAGVYYYQEIKAPMGYKLDSKPYKFVITDKDAMVKVTFTNDRTEKPIIPTPEKPIIVPDQPKTGDETNLVLYVILLLIASGAALGYAGRIKRKEEQDKE